MRGRVNRGLEASAIFTFQHRLGSQFGVLQLPIQNGRRIRVMRRPKF
jgi:hypothetical protein